jgi:hypothetical protein
VAAKDRHSRRSELTVSDIERINKIHAQRGYGHAGDYANYDEFCYDSVAEGNMADEPVHHIFWTLST